MSKLTYHIMAWLPNRIASHINSSMTDWGSIMLLPHTQACKHRCNPGSHYTYEIKWIQLHWLCDLCLWLCGRWRLSHMNVYECACFSLCVCVMGVICIGLQRISKLTCRIGLGWMHQRQTVGQTGRETHDWNMCVLGFVRKLIILKTIKKG